MDKVWLKIVRGTAKGYRLSTATALNVTKMGPFSIVPQISKVSIKLSLPEHLQIHPVVSIAHLKPAFAEPV